MLGQRQDIERVLKKFNMQDANPTSVPSDLNVKLVKSSDDQKEEFPYGKAIGSLLYAAIVSRPDIAYAVGAASRSIEKPGTEHVAAGTRIMKYSRATSDEGIVYDTDTELFSYTDADFAQMETRKSTIGFVFLLNVMVWESQE
uniref:Reverse transcriptase Ty1/copia-type domain-containing protein n=1 Tax=Bracon brevicornis TaxID=1563983 RepID=A0A6V7M2P7_9HYME